MKNVLSVSSESFKLWSVSKCLQWWKSLQTEWMSGLDAWKYRSLKATQSEAMVQKVISAFFSYLVSHLEACAEQPCVSPEGFCGSGRAANESHTIFICSAHSGTLAMTDTCHCCSIFLNGWTHMQCSRRPCSCLYEKKHSQSCCFDIWTVSIAAIVKV